MNEFKNKTTFWTEVLEQVAVHRMGAPEKFRIAMSGGSALQLFDQLKLHDFDWQGTEVSVVDERCVPLDHVHSNSGKIAQILSDTGVSLNLFENPADRAQSLEAYTKTLHADDEGDLFDLTILGVGPDGHTASLFPHSAALDRSEWVVPSETDVFDVRERMGLSFTAIEKSKKILVLMIGAGKQEIFKTLQNPDVDAHDYPAKRVLDMPQAMVMWLNQ